MYVIIVYDIEEKRVAKACKYLRQHLNWVQNSVFEGEVTEAHLERIKAGLRKIISDDKDAVIFYLLSSEKWIQRETMGVEKSPATNLL
jgi:CRISPR-associated protein Cas2